MTPKFHVLIELCVQNYSHGSPALYGAWFDEARNLEIKKICGGAHHSLFSLRVLNDFNGAGQQTPSGRERTQKRRKRALPVPE